VYISRDDAFDEVVFVFNILYANVGALIHQEILVIGSSLLNSEHWNEIVEDLHVENNPTTNLTT
jgi:hypothetical protein